MLFLGCDPDTKRPAFSAVNERGDVVWLWCPKLDTVFDLSPAVQGEEMESEPFFDHMTRTGQFVKYACLENQYIPHGERATRLLELARNSGACAMVAHQLFGIESFKLIQPGVWKGTVPKHIHQARVLKRIGWGHIQKGGKTPYSVPKNPPEQWKHLKAGEWKHLVDAIGMARWCWKIWKTEQETGMKKWQTY